MNENSILMLVAVILTVIVMLFDDYPRKKMKSK